MTRFFLTAWIVWAGLFIVLETAAIILGYPCPACLHDGEAQIRDMSKDGTPQVLHCERCGALYSSNWPQGKGDRS